MTTYEAIKRWVEASGFDCTLFEINSSSLLVEGRRRLTYGSPIEQFKKYMQASPVGSADLPHYFLAVFQAARVDDLYGDALSGAAFWRWLQRTWSGFDRIPHSDFEKLFNDYRDDWSPECMTNACREMYDALSDDHPITVYRGQCRKAPVGLSWTLDRRVAEDFAQGHRGIRPTMPVIYKVKIRKPEIAFVCADRQECEVVLFSAPSVARSPAPPRKLLLDLSQRIADEAVGQGACCNQTGNVAPRVGWIIVADCPREQSVGPQSILLQRLRRHRVDNLIVHIAPQVRCDVGILLIGNVAVDYEFGMPKVRQFRDIITAPHDGTTIEVMQGLKQEVVRAYWSANTQAFVRDDDDTRKTLHRVTGWRPVK